MPKDKATHTADAHAADQHRGPIGVGAEATEGIRNVDMPGAHKRTGLEHQTPGTLPGAEPLRERTWVHESGYGGRNGEARTSSDTRESSEHATPTTPLPESPLPDKRA